PQPPNPYPWTWRCHKCRSTYRLSATRRCLECGHTFCIKVISSNKSSKRGSSSRRQDTRTCSAEYDYTAWQAWGSFRRLPSSDTDAYATHFPQNDKNWYPVSRREAQITALEKEKSFVSGKYDCSLHCDYPSECRHSVYKSW
ncbi:hypothetical protein QBC38DRAFT_335573, partial [Podospora fimiseda]